MPRTKTTQEATIRRLRKELRESDSRTCHWISEHDKLFELNAELQVKVNSSSHDKRGLEDEVEMLRKRVSNAEKQVADFLECMAMLQRDIRTATEILWPDFELQPLADMQPGSMLAKVAHTYDHEEPEQRLLRKIYASTMSGNWYDRETRLGQYRAF